MQILTRCIQQPLAQSHSTTVKKNATSQNQSKILVSTSVYMSGLTCFFCSLRCSRNLTAGCTGQGLLEFSCTHQPVFFLKYCCFKKCWPKMLVVVNQGFEQPLGRTTQFLSFNLLGVFLCN